MLNNRYQIIQELGSGGFGTTYLAKDKQIDDSLCAIKKLNLDRVDLEIARKFFKREADTLLQLQGVHQIPKFIDYFEELGDRYIVEEYIEGYSLDDLISDNWSVESIVIFLWDILSILQLLHNQNIVHRDIKPSNLIQRKKDRKIIIIDFGAVKEIDPNQEQKPGTRVISDGYAPPEQTQGIPKLNSDIYALGMTAIQLLTKEPPGEVIRDRGDRVISPESRLAPLWLVDILNKMVRTDFKKRYQSVEEVLKDLGQRNIQQQSTITADSFSISENNLNNLQKTVNLALRNYLKKLWYIPLIILPLLIASEAANPWLRTRYYLNRGNSLLDDNQAQASLGKFQQAIALQRDSAAGWKGRGDALFILGRYSGALEAYNKAIAIEPENIKALNNKGKILSWQGEPQQAIDTYQQAIKIDPKNAEAWSGKGLAYMSMQQPEQALASFEQAQKIKPDEPNFWLQKGIVLHALQLPQQANKFYAEAIAVYDEVTVKEKNDPLLWTDRGFVLLQLNRSQDAFASYDRALSIDNNFYEALLGKANAYITVRDYEEALSLLDRAKEVRHQDYQVWYNRGNLLLQALGNRQEAFLSFERANQLKADFYPAWLGQGLALNSLQRYDEALLALDTAKELNSQDPYLWMNRGIALEALEEPEAALKSYQTAIELNFSPAKERFEQLKAKLYSNKK